MQVAVRGPPSIERQLAEHAARADRREAEAAVAPLARHLDRARARRRTPSGRSRPRRRASCRRRAPTSGPSGQGPRSSCSSKPRKDAEGAEERQFVEGGGPVSPAGPTPSSGGRAVARCSDPRAAMSATPVGSTATATGWPSARSASKSADLEEVALHRLERGGVRGVRRRAVERELAERLARPADVRQRPGRRRRPSPTEEREPLDRGAGPEQRLRSGGEKGRGGLRAPGPAPRRDRRRADWRGRRRGRRRRPPMARCRGWPPRRQGRRSAADLGSRRGRPAPRSQDALEQSLRLVADEAARYLARARHGARAAAGPASREALAGPLPADGVGSLAAVRELIEAAWRARRARPGRGSSTS